MSIRDPWLELGVDDLPCKHPTVGETTDILWRISNLEKYSTSSENLYSSSTSTNEGDVGENNTVSKSIDIKEDEQMTIDNRPVHLFFHRHYVEEFVTDIKDDFKNLPNQILCCTNWSELSEKLKLNPKTICFHTDELEYSSAIEIVNMVHTLSKLVNLEHEITVTVAVNKKTPHEVVKQLQKTGIFGIIPTHDDFGWEESIKGLKAQWANIPYWPKYIIEQLHGAKKNNNTKPGEIKLTLRQQQILDLIKERGASNKVIARTLNISESTVKLHVGIVLKKFNVKNRTQLALFSK